MRRLLLALALPLLLASCREPTAASDDTLSVTSAPPVLRLTNRGDERIFWMAADENTLALIDWIACVDPASCLHLEPRETREVPLDLVVGYTSTTTHVSVLWWRSEGGGGDAHPGPVHSLRVRL